MAPTSRGSTVFRASRRQSGSESGSDGLLQARARTGTCGSEPITELNPPLRFLAPQQRVEMSVADAERLGLKTGDEVRVAQNGTSVIAKVDVKERIAAGTVLPDRGHQGRQRQRAAQRRRRST